MKTTTQHQQPAKIPYQRILLALVFCCSAPAMAVDSLMLDDPVQQALYQQLTREIRCPDCQNQSLADAETSRAANHRREIRDLIIAGFDEPKIKAFLVERYGEAVLYQPQFRLATSPLWLAPALFVVLALVTYRRALRHRNATTTAGDVESKTSGSSATGSAPTRLSVGVPLTISAIAILAILGGTNENVTLSNYDHFPGILITLALIFYSIGVWSERMARRLKSWHLIFFWGGVITDTWATALMARIAGGLVLNLHGLSGGLAVLLMAVHAIWATVVLARNNAVAIAQFHRFSIIVWAVWLVPYFSGFVMTMR